MHPAFLLAASERLGRVSATAIPPEPLGIQTSRRQVSPPGPWPRRVDQVSPSPPNPPIPGTCIRTTPRPLPGELQVAPGSCAYRGRRRWKPLPASPPGHGHGHGHGPLSVSCTGTKRAVEPRHHCCCLTVRRDIKARLAARKVKLGAANLRRPRGASSHCTWAVLRVAAYDGERGRRGVRHHHLV